MYGFELLGEVVGSFSTAAQPSAQELAALQDQITAFEVPAIFLDETANPILAEQLAQDTGVNLVRIYTGSLGSADSPAADYIAMMHYNVEAIVTALQK
jgi:ABC-type Zn uptake system ZnuABC Zn-binding protein ZnuA